MAERGIIYIDTDTEEDAAWKVHVRREDGDVDLLRIRPDVRDVGWWIVRNTGTGESWGRFKSLGDAFMQALDPIAPEEENRE